MAIFRKIDASLPRQQASQDDLYVSVSLYSADLVPNQELYEVNAVNEVSSVNPQTVIRTSTETLSDPFSTPHNTGIMDLFRDRVIYTYDGSTIDGIDQAQGLVTEDRQITLGIFNGFTENVVLERLDITTGQGVEIQTPSQGIGMTPLQEIPLIIIVRREGPVTFDADITIKLQGKPELYVLKFTGVRISIPYILDAEWASGISVIRRYMTSIFKGANSDEVRASLRSNPIRKVEAPMFFGSSTATLQAWTSLKKCAQSEFLMPFVPDTSEMTADQVNRTIYVDTRYKNFKEGGFALLVSYNNDRSVDYQSAIQILTVEDDYIVSQYDIPETYSTGDIAYPAMVCLPAIDGSTMEATTSAAGLINLSATEIYGSDMFNIENAGYVPDTFNGLPISPLPVNWGSQVSFGLTRHGNIREAGSGQRYYTLGTRTSFTMEAMTTASTKEKAWEFLGFLNHISGREKAFWMAVPLEMFLEADLSGGGGVSLSITIDNLAEAYTGEISYLQLEYNNVFEIVKVNNVIDNTTSVTIVTEPATPTANEITAIYNAGAVRLSSDEVTQKHITDELSEFEFSVIELPGNYE